MIVRCRYRWLYALLQIVIHTTTYTQGSTNKPEDSVTTAKAALIADEEQVVDTQVLSSGLSFGLNGNISDIRTLHDDTPQMNATNSEGQGHDTKDEITTNHSLNLATDNNTDVDTTTLHSLDVAKDNDTVGVITTLYPLDVIKTLQPLNVAKDNDTNGTITTHHPLDVVKENDTNGAITTLHPLDAAKDNKTNVENIQNTIGDGGNHTMNNTTDAEIYDTPPITTLTPTDTKAPTIESQHEATKLVVATTKQPISHNVSKPEVEVTNITEPDVIMDIVCGINTMKENGSCVCNSGWALDPLMSDTLNCPCKDLCATADGDSCPQDAGCVMESCNRMTCRCEQSLFFNKVQKKCIGVCEYYGRSLCKGANERCVPADGGFQCHCQDGFSRKGKDCTDINECSEGQICQDNEECRNTIGSSLCACKMGFLRATDGKCKNVNECLVPSLHDCDQLCDDRQPPESYVCSCFQGFSWNDSQRICTRDNTTSSCECSDPTRSECVLVEGLSQQKKCYPMPGWQGDDGNVQDVNECSASANVDQWCGAKSYCMNSDGSASCICRDGFTNTTINYGQCDAVTCPTGQVVSGSQCVAACSNMDCPVPYRCVVNNDGNPECHCMSECLRTAQPNSLLSIYHGAFTLRTEEEDRESLNFVLTSTLELVFGAGAVEILELTSSLRSKRQTQVTYDVEFTVIQERGDLQEELSILLKKSCLDLPSDDQTCALPGGSTLLKDSITLSVRDPCSPSPCPGSLFECKVRSGAAGRADCICKDGYFKIPITGAMGVCEDVDECTLESHNCKGECINTPGSFVCRDIAPETTEKSIIAAGISTHRDLAISFGVLFIICLIVAIGLACMLIKRNNRTGEMIPMTSNGSVGVDNLAYST